MNAVIDIWIGGTVLLWLLMLRGTWQWGEGFRLVVRPTTATQRVRVCVPARNEVDNIRPCVEAVLGSQGVEIELVVADDDSQDGTAVVALAAGEDDARFRLVDVSPRPAGWAGKPWACMAAAAGADADWLLFIDADVRVSPHAIAASVQRGIDNRADLLSLFGTWELQSFWEQVAIPAIGWFIRGASAVPEVNSGQKAFANGQFILMRREAWLEIGGHEAVRGEVLDDVRLAEAAHRAGQRLWLLWAPEAFRVRLYTGLEGIVSGYRKNLYEGTGRQPVVALAAALGVSLTTLLPPLLIVIFAMGDMPLRAGWALLITILIVVWRGLVEQIDGRSGASAPLHFLGAAVLVYVLLSSMFASSTRWKGRSFEGGRAQ